jgi:chemotaxis receptor (MCP) glutamine deamidase CheD
MESAASVLRKTQGMKVGQENVHFRRRFSSRRQLELHTNTIDGDGLASVSDLMRGRDK